MSSRWYPLYVKGNPQLRIFLPNFWMKLVKPKFEVAPNTAQFIVPLQMTKVDVKNYLEKIYNVSVLNVRIAVVPGEIKRQKHKGYVTKDDDYKAAFITLPRGETFTFPDLFPKEAQKEIEKEMTTMKKMIHQQKIQKWKQDSSQPGIPSWFS